MKDRWDIQCWDPPWAGKDSRRQQRSDPRSSHSEEEVAASSCRGTALEDPNQQADEGPLAAADSRAGLLVEESLVAVDDAALEVGVDPASTFAASTVALVPDKQSPSVLMMATSTPASSEGRQGRRSKPSWG